IGNALAQLAQLDDAGRQQALVAAVSRGLRKSSQRIDLAELPDPVGRALLETTLRGALQAAADPGIPEPARLQAIGLLATAPWGYSGVVLSERVVPQEPPAVQLAAVQAIGEYPETGLDNLLLERFPQVTAEVQHEIVATLLRRPDRTLALLQAIASGGIPAGVIDATQRQLLLSHRQERVAELAQQALGASAGGERQAIVRDYQAQVAGLKGNPEQGVKVFDRVCATCHQVAGRGHAIGPNLAASAGRETQTLIQHLFDPNQVVLPNYLLYTVLDTRGQTHSGMIASQTATSLSLRREKETVVTLLRSEIEELNSTGKSLMPEGLEKDLAPQDVSDLAAWLQAQSESPVSIDARKQRDKGTLAGTLVEPPPGQKPNPPSPKQ
ncbi:MAG: c-type cytochrome, partial [Planctomycetaceae bacterium]